MTSKKNTRTCDHPWWKQKAVNIFMTADLEFEANLNASFANLLLRWNSG